MCVLVRMRVYFCARFWAGAGTKNESVPACVMRWFVWLTRIVLRATMGRAYPTRNSQLMQHFPRHAPSLSDSRISRTAS